VDENSGRIVWARGSWVSQAASAGLFAESRPPVRPLAVAATGDGRLAPEPAGDIGLCEAPAFSSAAPSRGRGARDGPRPAAARPAVHRGRGTADGASRVSRLAYQHRHMLARPEQAPAVQCAPNVRNRKVLRASRERGLPLKDALPFA